MGGIGRVGDEFDEEAISVSDRRQIGLGRTVFGQSGRRITPGREGGRTQGGRTEGVSAQDCDSASAGDAAATATISMTPSSKAS